MKIHDLQTYAATRVTPATVAQLLNLRHTLLDGRAQTISDFTHVDLARIMADPLGLFSLMSQTQAENRMQDFPDSAGSPFPAPGLVHLYYPSNLYKEDPHNFNKPNTDISIRLDLG